MRRAAEERLVEWLGSEYRKPLVIRGARQVGKSTLIRHFAERNHRRLHEVNLERHPRLASLFESQDTDRIRRELEFLCQNGPVSGADSLLFLDEIQATPIAIQTLRYFYEDCPELAVIAAGSLLEFALADHSFSMPVGRVEYLFLGPMTFQEYLLAADEVDLLALLESWTWDKPFPTSAHERLLDRQRSYLLTGGMPEAVDRFIATGDLEQARQVQVSVLETFRDDFGKYARKGDLSRLHRIFDYVPAAIGEKLKYSNVDPKQRSRDLGAALDLLVKAQVVLLAYHSDATGLPLGATLNDRVFKPYFLDCGLVSAQCGITGLTLEQLRSTSFINEGKLAEQFIAQHLIQLGRQDARPQLTYWLREGRSANAEVDFVMELAGSVMPLEVKAGKSGTLKSLLQFVHQRGMPAAVRFDLGLPSRQRVEHALRQAKGSVEVSYDLLSLPLYLVEQLPRLFGEG